MIVHFPIQKQLLLLLFALFQYSLVAQKESYPVADIPAVLRTNAHVVVRHDEMVFRLLNDGSAEVETFYVATILHEKGKSAATMVAVEDPFVKVKLLKGRVFDANGVLVRSSKDEDIQMQGSVAEYEFTDNKARYLELEHPGYPYTVEFRQKKLMKGFLDIPSSVIQHLGYSVETWKYRLEVPADYKFKWKVLNLDIQPQQRNEGRTAVWEWQASNLSALPDEPYSPYFHDVYSRIDFAPETVRYDGYTGNFKDWANVGQFFYELNKDRETLPSETLANIQALCAGKSEREKIAALYRHTQENCRYVSIQLGIGGWQAFEAGFVDKKKYGDCKALSNYTQALLKAAGIEAWEASIYAGDEGAPACDTAFPSPWFNHEILYVPSQNCWLECTSKTHPAGYLGEFTANRQALLYTPQGGKLVNTPALTPADNFEKTNTDIVLYEDASAKVQHRACYGGARHERTRRFALEETQKSLEESFARNADFSIGRLHSIRARAEQEHPVATLEYLVETPKFATLSGKRMFVPLTKTDPVKRGLPANEKRQLDLRMDDAYTLRDTFSIHFPAGYEAESVPSGKKIEGEFGAYEIQVEKFPDHIIVLRNVEIHPIQVPAARYGEVRQFLLDAAKADAAQMVLVKKQ